MVPWLCLTPLGVGDIGLFFICLGMAEKPMVRSSTFSLCPQHVCEWIL